MNAGNKYTHMFSFKILIIDLEYSSVELTVHLNSIEKKNKRIMKIRCTIAIRQFQVQPIFS